MADIEQLTLSYPDFILGQTIDPEEFDQNNTEIVVKINETIDKVNGQDTVISEINTKADEAVATANAAVATANASEAKIDDAVLLVGTANTNATNALTTANQAINEANIANETSIIAIQASVGNTIIKNELYTIVNANLGNGTFSYKDVDETVIIGDLGSNNEQIFTLVDGTYPLGENRIEIIKNSDVLLTSIGGGITEIDETHVQLNTPAIANDVINIKYFERLGLGGEHYITHEVGQVDEIGGLVHVNSVQPSAEKAVWFKVVE